MNYTEIQHIALSILTSIITGGFVLVFVEIGNRKNRENDRYEQILRPFMHKLSSYFRYILWYKHHIKYPSQLNENEENFKTIINEVYRHSTHIISGSDYDIDSFTADQLNKIALGINNIWYYHNRMKPCRISIDPSVSNNKETIKKELAEINPIYSNKALDVNSLVEISSYFFTDVYKPIERDTYKHKAYIQHYKSQTIVVSFFVIYVLIMLCTMMFTIIPLNILQLSTSFAILMLVFSLLALGVDTDTQIEYKNRCNKGLYSFVKWLYTFIDKNKILLLRLFFISLILSIWTFFSIKANIIPKIPCQFISEYCASIINHIFVCLAYCGMVYIIVALLLVGIRRFKSKIMKRNFENPYKSAPNPQLHRDSSLRSE